MLFAVLSGFAAALLVPVVYRLAGKHTGWAVAVVPGGLTVYFALLLARVVGAGTPLREVIEWVPSLGISLAFQADGLSLLFALLVVGIGTLIMLYGVGYFKSDENMPRFYVVVLIFMAAMLGLVLADNLFLLYIFWELTSISSFILIGYYNEKHAARMAAQQALLVTAIGGLAMLAGLVMLGITAGTFTISELAAQSEIIKSGGLYLPMLILVLLGAFTKSAQFPFHFWLPGAMQAPTPVSAYLHSATMVKAGVYLIARLSASLGGTPAWVGIVTIVGAVTMVIAAYLAVQQTDLKRILAYSTVSALGIMVMLLGLGTEEAVLAALLFVVVHSFYKGAMFMVAGAIDHETGTRDIRQLGGLFSIMPVLGAAVILAAVSKAGIPPALGFLGKEYIYEAALFHTPITQTATYVLTGAAVIANTLIGISGFIVAVVPFFGEQQETPHHAHPAPATMAIGPLVLGVLGIATGLIPELFSEWVLAPGVSAVLVEPFDKAIHFPTEISPMVILSAMTIALAVIGYVGLGALNRALGAVDVGQTIGPERLYDTLYHGVIDGAEAITRRLQGGNLRTYLATIVFTFIALFGVTLFTHADLGAMLIPERLDVRFYEVALALIIVVATLVVITTRYVLVAVAGLGVIGYGVAMLFMLFSAPDLAMTQFAVETLSVVLFVLVLYRLPDFKPQSSESSRLRDIGLALGVGGLITGIVLVANTLPLESRLSRYFVENSVVEAQGRNIVNVILVDFRALDTLGEITVVTVAAIGVFALLKLTMNAEDPEEAAGD